MFAPVLGAAEKSEALFVVAVFVVALIADGLGAGAVLGTETGSLHFGQGRVCPSSCSWRTTILLEQWGHASLNGSTWCTKPGQWKSRIHDQYYDIPGVEQDANPASLSARNSLSLGERQS